MGDWGFHLADYWDQRTDAVNRHARRLAQVGNIERIAACKQIQAGVLRGMDRFADLELLKAAVCMVDDLYEFVNDIVIMDNAILDYLAASCLTFTTPLRERGYVIHYVDENRFSGIDFIKLGPCDLFPQESQTLACL